MRRLAIFLLLLVLVGTGLFLWLRADEGAAAVGPPVALCPGPDLYGYICAEGSAFAYVDARENTGLQLDDGVVQLSLPFPFTFYGTDYETLWASSNGILQFGAHSPAFNNRCLDAGPATDMGDMIAPYWDDLDLTLAGALETETVGEAPDRIFVIEWDEVPPFANPEESVTFSVQLHEANNDIVFLYPDATTSAGLRGSSATVGLQSEVQGLALQYSCDQAVIADGSGLHFRHPADANEAVGLEARTVAITNDPFVSAPALKEPAALLQERFTSRGEAALPTLRRHWLNQSSPLRFTWQWGDLDGDGAQELIALWHSPGERPGARQDVAQIAVFHRTESQKLGTVAELVARYASPLSTRQQTFARPRLLAVRDLTGDMLADLVLADNDSGRVAIIVLNEGSASLHHLPDTCEGQVALRDANRDGIVDLLRDECSPLSPKTTYTWQGDQFVPLSP